MKKFIVIALFSFFLISPAFAFASSPQQFNLDVFSSMQKEQKLQDTVFWESRKIKSEKDYMQFIQKRYINFFKLFNPIHKPANLKAAAKALRSSSKLNIISFQAYLLFLDRTLKRVHSLHPEIAIKHVGLTNFIRWELLNLWEASVIVEHTSA